MDLYCINSQHNLCKRENCLFVFVFLSYTMEIRDDWVGEVVFHLKKYLLNVENIWSEIGYSSKKHSELQESLKNNLTNYIHSFLSSAEKEKAELECKVDQLRGEIVTIEKELQIPHKHISSSQTLLAILDELTCYHSELDMKIAELTSEFRKLKSCEEDLCQLLHVAVLEGFPLIPSYNDKLRVQHHIDELQGVKKERIDKLAKMKHRIISCIDYLKSDCNLMIPESVKEVISAEVEPSDLSEAYLQELDGIQDQYMDLFHKFKSEEEDLFENIESLRKRLNLSPFTLPKEHSLCPSKRIKYGSEELSRLRELRLANLRRLMEASVLELEGVWTDCLVSTEYCQTFRNSMSMNCTEENLSRLEGEVHKWKRFKSSHQDFYDALTVWLDTLRQIKAIELKRQDPAVLKNRGGILLKLDKEDRKLRTRDLPNQTAHLESIIAQECESNDADLFPLVCFEGQPLAGQKENSLASIIDRSLEPSGSVVAGSTSSTNKTTKGGFVYATNKRPAAARGISPSPLRRPKNHEQTTQTLARAGGSTLVDREQALHRLLSHNSHQAFIDRNCLNQHLYNYFK
ncbi:protein regulator of cytokinesis 1 [Echinococcus multilocularis]|uniref:Protein regulator of cytokinesis 1 n=1 Tax=Echinococcus multilocularis TaxID=6211 RepID=A0A068Y990_ECHMU|nr:protein regulator of cytokinesis 1 [Echinococcus multilocularis]